jgi:sulfonate transport system substrate-binding protein
MKKKLYISLIIGLVLLVLSACGSKSTTSDAKEGSEQPKEEAASNEEKVISIGYQRGNTINILKETGILDEKAKEAGYTIDWREFVRGGAVMEAIYTGNIDFGHAADGPGIFAQASNKPFVYVGADHPHSQGVGILVHADSGIKSVEDLKGKSITALRGGNHHYLSVLALQEAGLSADDVEWKFLDDAAQMRSAFETKQVDAMASYDPFLAAAEIALDTVNLTEGKDYQYPNHTFYFASEEFNKNHPELVDMILEAIDESDRWANENKPEVVEMIAESLNTEQEVIKKAMDRREFGVEKINEDIAATQQKQADIYAEIGLIPDKIDVTEKMNLQ